MHAPAMPQAGPGVDSGEPTIRFTGVGKQFDDTWVLRNVDLGIRPGSIHGMIGPSGCGKTTTVRLALGYFRPDEGSVELFGSDPVTRSNTARKAVGYLPQHPILFDDLSLWQNLNYHASLNGVPFDRKARLEELLDLVDLGDDRKKRVREASGGMKRRLALAATLVHRPPLLILDEPTAGIDPILRRQLWDEFRDLRDQGTTLVVTTQFVEEAAYCDEVAILARGGVQADRPPSELVSLAYGGRRFDLQFDRTVSGRVLDALDSIEMTVSANVVSERTVRVVLRGGDHAEESDDNLELREAIERQLDGEIGESFVSLSEVPVEWNDVFAQIVDPESSRSDVASVDDPFEQPPSPEDAVR